MQYTINFFHRQIFGASPHSRHQHTGAPHRPPRRHSTPPASGPRSAILSACTAPGAPRGQTHGEVGICVVPQELLWVAIYPLHEEGECDNGLLGPNIVPDYGPYSESMRYLTCETPRALGCKRNIPTTLLGPCKIGRLLPRRFLTEAHNSILC